MICHAQLSGLEDALEYIELEEKFASQKPKDAAGQGKKKQPTVLDPRKAYNICELIYILYTSLPTTHPLTDAYSLLLLSDYTHNSRSTTHHI